MAQFTATWADLDDGIWEAGDHPTVENWEFVGQNIEYLGQTHNHGGDTPDGTKPANGEGAILYLKSPLHIIFMLGAVN